MTLTIHRNRAPARQRLAGLMACILLGLSGTGIAGDSAGADTMDGEIDYLVAAVADSACIFIRNGREHDAGKAGEHLQMKRERGRRYYDSTEQFIERIASKSSLSGKPYLIRCGADTQEAEVWFKARLAEYRQDGAE